MKKTKDKILFSVYEFLGGDLGAKYLVSFCRGDYESNSPLFFDSIKEVKRFIRKYETPNPKPIIKDKK